MTNWKISEEQATRILDTKPTEIKETGIKSDTNMTEDERVRYANSILEGRFERR